MSAYSGGTTSKSIPLAWIGSVSQMEMMGGKGRMRRKSPFSSFSSGDDGFSCMTYVTLK